MIEPLPMSRTRRIFLLIGFCLACQSERRIDEVDLLGEWTLSSTTQINYPSVSFSSDSMAVFTSQADTIYRYRYFVKWDSLILIDIDGKQSRFKILELSKSSLIFNGLPDQEGKQVYSR